MPEELVKTSTFFFLARRMVLWISEAEIAIFYYKPC